MDQLSKKRFGRALQYAIEYLAKEAKCFGYKNDEEYQTIHKQLVETKNRLIQEYKDEETLLMEAFRNN